MINRMTEIKKKGFNIPMAETQDDLVMSPFTPVDFSKIKVGAKTLSDATLDLGALKKVNPRHADKFTVMEAIAKRDLKKLREISDFFFRTSGIYRRICLYMAKMYCYDWVVTPIVNSKAVKDEKVIEGFWKSLTYIDNFGVKKFCGDVALKVMRYGCYYGYRVKQSDREVIQELPVNYCRSRFAVNGRPAIEFHMRYFDDMFRDTEQRIKIIKLFPKEFEKGYRLYKLHKLPPQFIGDSEGWYLLDPKLAIKFNLNGEDYPPFASVIPNIIDLDNAQDLDRKKMAQQLLKILVQKMPIDKNGDLVFDVDEARELHNNAVRMLARSIGIDVLTTFADVAVEDMADTRSSTATDELEKIERAVYNDAGISQMQFNTDGNIALEKSIRNDEASMYDLILQFEEFLQSLLEPYNKNSKKLYYQAQMLRTTIYNYQELSKLYKEQTQLGYSKVLPQVALGQSQLSVIANAIFENQIMNLSELFVPPMSSNTMSSKTLQQSGGSSSKSNTQQSQTTQTTTKTTVSDTSGGAGRPEKPDDEKSTKTLQNKESMS